MSDTSISSEVFIPSPGKGTSVLASSYYTRKEGPELISIHNLSSRSDTVDAAFLRFSEDNGRTWSEPRAWPTRFEHPDGVGRRHPRGGFVDPNTGRYVSFWTEGVLPTDNPLEGMTHWTVHYSVSEDGGRTNKISEPIIHEGAEFDARHPLPGVTVGHNCVQIGDLGQRPLTRRDGIILMPVQSSPVGPGGRYHNPGGGLTFTDCLLLMGRWRSDGRLSWTVSDRVRGNPAQSTRGLIEPTLAELQDGSLIMVMRGSNDRRPSLPGHRWVARSCDGGMHWTLPEPWTYEDGERFFSPSSCSQLIPWHDGRLFWLGNIVKKNPVGNRPRYPLVLGEVDTVTGRLRRHSLKVVDDRRPEEGETLTLSNFYAREDRADRSLRLHMSRLFARQDTSGQQPLDWTAEALIYRIEV